MTDLSFEQGPIRPPSEAFSLLLRFSRNCPWNKCQFCPVYKGRTFSRRSVAEVKVDIDTVARIIALAQDRSQDMGQGGRITREAAQSFFDQDLSHAALSVVAWLYNGTGAVFLQDANNLILAADALVEMLEYLNQKVSGITRITSYARSQTAARKTVEELTRIRQAGLTRIHVGMESGSDRVLEYMNKGTKAKDQIEGGRRIKAAGMELSEYYMPGLGGRAWSREHALESARVLRAVNPDFIRLRTLRIPNRVELFEKAASGEFVALSDDEAAQEIRWFIENLDGIDSYVASDHAMNLLQDVEGQLPRDKAFMLEAIDRYLALDPDQKLHYRLGRRMGLYLGVVDMAQPGLFAQVEAARRRIQTEHPQALDAIIGQLADRMV
jgi:hypothetical protein